MRGGRWNFPTKNEKYLKYALLNIYVMGLLLLAERRDSNVQGWANRKPLGTLNPTPSSCQIIAPDPYPPQKRGNWGNRGPPPRIGINDEGVEKCPTFL